MMLGCASIYKRRSREFKGWGPRSGLHFLPNARGKGENDNTLRSLSLAAVPLLPPGTGRAAVWKRRGIAGLTL